MTWRDVLDCKIAGYHLDNLAEMAFKLGYEFICHNGRIYFIGEVNGQATVFPTALTVESLEDWDGE